MASDMRKMLSVILLLLVPACCFLYPYACGFLNLSQGYIMFLLPMMLFGPPLVTGIVASFLKAGSWQRHLGICVGLYVAVVAVFFAGPAGAVKWTIGFAYNLRLTKNPVRIQQWATEVLARYDSGKLATKPKAEYWATGKGPLAEKEIPELIRKLWWDKPSIGIATMSANGWVINPNETNISAVISESEPTNRVHCVAFSWYLTGVLVGPPDFKPTWNPWYSRQIIPGVYAFSGMK
jgi:hypothetical protein